jgi:Stress responsive A/B Barrel Domain
MIRHVVLIRFKPEANTAHIFAELQALRGQISGITAISTGVDQSPEGLQRGNTHAFTVDFKDAMSRDAYLPHPAHQKVGAMIVAGAEGGIEGITVLDWEMEA